MDERQFNSLHPVRIWLGCMLALILVMVAVGGITRLTESGLSMVTWEPILGAWPPVSQEDWQFRFDQYRSYPEYQQLKRGMSLDEFKFIFFWEYFHRLLGRLLGIAYFVPVLVFWIKGLLGGSLKWKLLLGLAGGGAQGLLGWYMVKSGLVDVPYVSHYRLAAHLGLAFILFSYLLWVLLTISNLRLADRPAAGGIRFLVNFTCVLLVLQIIWGAFVAGLNAGFIYNTFPSMQGYWIPPFLLNLEPWWRSFIDNPVAVQFMHRVMGFLLLTSTIICWIAARRDPLLAGMRRDAMSLFAGLIVWQFALGVMTLLLMVPLALGVMHQVTACLICGVAVVLLYSFNRKAITS